MDETTTPATLLPGEDGTPGPPDAPVRPPPVGRRLFTGSGDKEGNWSPAVRTQRLVGGSLPARILSTKHEFGTFVLVLRTNENRFRRIVDLNGHKAAELLVSKYSKNASTHNTGVWLAASDCERTHVLLLERLPITQAEVYDDLKTAASNDTAPAAAAAVGCGRKRKRKREPAADANSNGDSSKAYCRPLARRLTSNSQ